MANLRAVKGYYGTSNPTTIFVYEKRNGSCWYCADGSTNVNCTFDEITLGTNIETLVDVDFFEADKPVRSLEDLENEVDNFYS